MTVIASPHPPKDLSRSEKREFRRVLKARTALGRPVADAEINTLVDYVRVRERLSRLETIATHQRGGVGSTDCVPVFRTIDSTTALSRRLAHDLGLVPQPGAAKGEKARAQDRAEGRDASG